MAVASPNSLGQTLRAAAHRCASVPHTGVSDCCFFLCVPERHRMTIAICFPQIGNTFQDIKKNPYCFSYGCLGIESHVRINLCVMKSVELLDAQIEIDCGF